MEYINDLSYQTELNSVILIGKFDGVHRGHQLLIAKAKEIAIKQNCPCVAITFSNLPMKTPLISTEAEKRILLEQYGIDLLISYPFQEICDLSAEAFVSEILVSKLKAVCVVAGSDCGFGKNRSGNAEVLVTLGKKYGFETFILDKLRYEREEISSSLIRNQLSSGKVSKATALLGHPFGYYGEVVRGKQLGRTLGFPTINIIVDEEKVLVSKGVYSSCVEIDGKVYRGICNVGCRPTVSADGPVNIEMYILDYKGNLYGRRLFVCLLEFIRPEMKFDSLDQLTQQITKDLEELID